MSDGDPTWTALFERTPEDVTVADVRTALAKRRENRAASAGEEKEETDD